ncbi:MAG: cation:proton antiporter, partial [Thermodesulfobacteria bacterium]|nr:cation:proton antiporter [Thermodesulfobacteriota bacterium]
MITPDLIINLLLILAGAWICGSIAQRLGFPVMLGELVAGLILGPPLLGLVAPSPPIELLAELGIFFAMFYAGMEMDPKELFEHFWPSLGVALGGFVIPFVMGYAVTRLFGGTIYQSLFVGMGISITAIAVQAVILQNMRINRTELGHIIIGAAIVDDILSLITLSLLVGLVKTGSIEITALALILGKILLFFVGTYVVGHYFLPRITRYLTDEGAKGFTFALISAFIWA